MENITMHNQEKSLEERLEAYPKLKNRIGALLAIVENSGSDLEKADDAEQRVIEELRQMGNDVLHDWASSMEKKKSNALYTDNNEVTHHCKKKSIGIQHLER